MLTAIEMVGEFQREKALLLVALAVLAATGMEREAHRREEKIAVPFPRPRPSIVPPHTLLLCFAGGEAFWDGWPGMIRPEVLMLPLERHWR
jgi:hypothetical protein